MTLAVKSEFSYTVRVMEGCQSPVETLTRKTGSCRDFALLMMEAVRALGLAARFVSGYLWTPFGGDRRPGRRPARRNACLGQVYLPGAGWVEFDPTSGLAGNRNLIRIAVVRDPSQAVPISGKWTGAPADFLRMEVDVRVRAHDRPLLNG